MGAEAAGFDDLPTQDPVRGARNMDLVDHPGRRVSRQGLSVTNVERVPASNCPMDGKLSRDIRAPILVRFSTAITCAMLPRTAEFARDPLYYAELMPASR